MDWIPAIASTSAFAAVLWLLRKWIVARLTGSIAHEYDKKLETLRSELHKSEERFRADLGAKGSQIESLRAVALSNVSKRQDLIFEKQLAAIEQLWSAVVLLGPGKNISAAMAVFKFENMAKEAAKNTQVREMFLALGKNVEVTNFDVSGALKARPFVSLLAWAYFSAYQAIVFHALTQLQILKSGIDKDVIDTKGVIKLVKLALPHQSDYIDKYGSQVLYYLLDELETKLLISFQMMLDGKDLDEETIKKASAIIKQSEQVMADEKASAKSA